MSFELYREDASPPRFISERGVFVPNSNRWMVEDISRVRNEPDEILFQIFYYLNYPVWLAGKLIAMVCVAVKSRLNRNETSNKENVWK